MTLRAHCHLVPFLLIAAACGNDPEPSPFVSEPSQYIRLLPGFDTTAECVAAGAGDPLFQCTQTVRLCPDGSITVLLSDVINSGVYEIDGDQLTAAMTSPGEVPAELVFTIHGGALQALWLGERPFGADPDPEFTGFCE